MLFKRLEEDSDAGDEKHLKQEDEKIEISFKAIKLYPGMLMPQLMSVLDTIKQYTIIVADTGDFDCKLFLNTLLFYFQFIIYSHSEI